MTSCELGMNISGGEEPVAAIEVYVRDMAVRGRGSWRADTQWRGSAGSRNACLRRIATENFKLVYIFTSGRLDLSLTEEF